MRLNDDFVLRTIAGQEILINERGRRVDFNHMLSLNGSASWLWRKIREEDVDFDVDTLVGWLLDEYEVEPETAGKDVEELLEKWLRYGVVR